MGKVPIRKCGWPRLPSAARMRSSRLSRGRWPPTRGRWPVSCSPRCRAAELAALYTQRWEIETALDELKTHQGGHGFILRSQHPPGVEQEIYGFLLTHHALRALMHDTAGHAGADPDQISFMRTLRVVRRQVTDQAAFSHGTPETITSPHP